MAAVDVVPIPTNANYVAFDDLRLGRSTQQVVGRLLRFWDARNIKKDGQFMGIVLLLLDEKCSVIHAFIPAALASQFRQVLREGSIYNISGFEVGRCTKLYKITDHPFLLRFLPATTIVELSDVGPTIEREQFMLRNFANLQALANTNIELPDVVGQISFIQGSNLNDPTSTQRLVLRYRIDTSVIVYLSLWDDVAATFRAHLSSGDTINSVMLITTVNPKMFGGNLYLNSTSATRFFFDTSIQPIQEFIERMGIKTEEPIARADTAAGIRKKELVSIHQLHEFISKTDEQTQDADFLCNAKVLNVLQKNGWSYVSCTGCNRKLDKVGNALRCSKCVSSSVTGVVKYRVELAVHDGHDEATFVVFDNEMTKLITKTAATLILENGNGGTRDDIPSCIEDLTGKQYLFQIKVTPFNFSSKHRTFTVSKLSEAYTNCTQTEITKGGPTFNLDLEGTTSSNIARFGQDTLDKEYEKVTTSNVGTVEKSRKRGRE